MSYYGPPRGGGHRGFSNDGFPRGNDRQWHGGGRYFGRGRGQDHGYRGQPGGIRPQYNRPLDGTNGPPPSPAWQAYQQVGRNPPPEEQERSLNSFRSGEQELVDPSQPREENDLFLDWEWETKQRNQVFSELINLYGEQRLNALRALPTEEQLIFFFPDDVTSNSLPPMDPPSDWEQRVKDAIRKCKEDVMKLFRKRSHEDLNDSDSSHSSPGGFNAPDPWDEEVAFLEALEFCIPMTAAFHVLTIFARAGDNKCCYCPCGKHMDKWRQFTSMQEFASCDYKGRKDPASLWKHVLTKQEDCAGHKVVYLFLKTVFQNYHAEGIQHIALEDNQSPAYKKAERYIMKDLKSYVPGTIDLFLAHLCDSYFVVVSFGWLTSDFMFSAKSMHYEGRPKRNMNSKPNSKRQKRINKLYSKSILNWPVNWRRRKN